MKNKILIIGILIVALSAVFASCGKKDDDVGLVTGQKPGDIVTDTAGAAVTDNSGNTVTVAKAKQEERKPAGKSKASKKKDKSTDNSSIAGGNVIAGGNNSSSGGNSVVQQTEPDIGAERGDIIEIITEDPNKPKTTTAPGTTSPANSGGVKVISGDSKNDDSGDATINFS